jgi:hypothetical protein
VSQSNVLSHVSKARQFILLMIMNLGIVVDVLGEDCCFQQEMFQVLHFSY